MSAALAVIAGFLLHSAPARRAVLRRVVALAAQSNVVLVADSLDYNLFTLRVTLAGVSAAAAASPESPFFAADTIEIVVPTSALRGPITLDSVRLGNARVAVVRRADGTTNLPSGGGVSDGEPRAIRVDRVQASRLSVTVRDQRSDTSLVLPAIAVDVRPSSGSIRLDQIGSVARAGVGTTISRIDGNVSFDGRSVRLGEVSVVTGDAEVTVDGTLDVLVREPRANLRVTGRADVAQLVRWAGDASTLAGTLALDGTVGGPFESPFATLSLSVPRLAWNGLSLDDLSADVVAGRDGVHAPRVAARVFGGRVTGVGDYSFSSTRSELKADWMEVDSELLQRALAMSAPFVVTSRATGSAVVEGGGADWTGWTVKARTRLDPSSPGRGRVPVGGTVDVSVAKGRWQLSANNSIGAASFETTLRGIVNSTRPSSSTIAGRILARETAVPALLETLAAAGITVAAVDDVIADGRVSAETIASGTFAAPKFRMTVAARDLVGGSVSGVDADIDAEGDLDRIDVNVRLRQGESNTAEAKGTIAADGPRLDLDISAMVSDLSAFIPDEMSVTAAADVALRASGPVDALTLRGTATLTNARYQNIRVDRIDATIDVDPEHTRVDAIAHEIGVRAHTDIDRTTRQAAIELRATDSDLARLVRDTAPQVDLSGTVSLQGRATLPIDDWRGGAAAVEMARLDARAGDLPLRLAAPGRISYDAGTITVATLEAFLGETTLAIGGRLPLTDGSGPIETSDALQAVLTGDLARARGDARRRSDGPSRAQRTGTDRRANPGYGIC